jgi:hypothetical protein
MFEAAVARARVNFGVMSRTEVGHGSRPIRPDKSRSNPDITYVV